MNTIGNIVMLSICVIVITLLAVLSNRQQKKETEAVKIELYNFLKSHGYTIKENITAPTTAVKYKDGLGHDDICFVLIVSFKPMLIIGSQTKETKIAGGKYYVYEIDQYCLVEDGDDPDNTSIRLYREPYNRFEEPS